MKATLIRLAALALALLATLPALEGGFLADDYYLGQQIAIRVAEDPGLAAAVRDAFAHRWDPTFQLFRPLTILSIRADYALWGVNGGLHHLSNILAWLATAAVFAAVATALSGITGSRIRTLTFVLFATYPAAVEALGWLVARSDVFLTFSALLGLLARLRHPDRPWLLVLALLPGFLSSESCVVLVPALIWLDAICLDRPSRSEAGRSWRRRLLRRYLPSAALLVAYFLLRVALFGSIASSYNKQGYLAYLDQPDILGRCANALTYAARVFFVPVNTEMIRELAPALPRWLPAVVFLVPWAIIATLGIRNRRPGDLRLLLGFAPWVLAPILLLAPLFHVETSMEESRILTLSVSGTLLVLAVLLHRALLGAPRRATAAVLALLLAASAAMQVDLAAYERAAARAERVVRDLDAIPIGSRLVILRADDPAVAAALTIYNGAYVLSSGLNHATFPPFRPAPGIFPDHLPSERESELASVVTPPGKDGRSTRQRPQRPWLATLTLRDGQPRLRILAEGRFEGPPPVMIPGQGTTHPREEPLVFRARGPAHAVKGAERIRVVVREPSGVETVAEVPARPPHFRIEGRSYYLEVPGHLCEEISLGPEVLRTLRLPALVWWIEVLSSERRLLLSPYMVFTLDAP